MFDDSSDEHDGAEDDGAYAADGEVCFEVGVALPEGVAKWFSVRHALILSRVGGKRKQNVVFCDKKLQNVAKSC